MNDETRPGFGLLSESKWSFEGSLFVSQPSFQAMLAPNDLYSIQTVGLRNPFVPLLLLAGIVPIGLSLALIGHATDRNGLRNTGNIILYPFVAVIPVADIALVVSESPSLDFHYLFALTTGAATGTRLVLATAGQISGHHRMRNIGNFTYLGGIIILQTLFGLKFIF